MSLADLSAFVRSSLKWFLISLVVLFLLWLVWIWINGASKAVFKPKGADTAYGKLASPSFIKTYFPLRASRFELSTSLPKQEDKALVYQLIAGNKFSDKQVDDLLSLLNFSKGSQKKSGSVFSWSSSSGDSYLKLDNEQNHFFYKYNFLKESSILSSHLSIDEKVTLNKSKEILTQLGLVPEEISKGAYSLRYLKISGGGRQKTSASSANAVEISFYRKVDDIVSSGDAPIRLLFGASFKILEFDFYYSPIDPVGSPYPIISGQQAWQNFQNGKSFATTSSKFDSVSITKVSLSYWESALPQKYLQPIWVFTGKGKVGSQEEEFTTYTSAISPSFLAQ